MPDLVIPWRPRLILAGRAFRLPVQTPDENVALEAEGFDLLATRRVERDGAVYHYLKAPSNSGDYTLTARAGGQAAEVTVTVRTLDELRQPFEYRGATYPRRWPVGRPHASTKRRQTLQDEAVPERLNEGALAWWAGQPDGVLWSQLPPAELPKAHFVNCHQGCPDCGTAIFRYGGFYPWKRSHLPCDFKSACPNCGSVFPSNDLASGDYVSGERVDDGYGYFDADGRIYLFAATYHRDQCRTYEVGIRSLMNRLRAGGFDEGIARRLGLMLLRYAFEELYVASAVQFRYGPSKGVEEPWDWGQPDWADELDPVTALRAKGSIRYCIDTPYVAETLALAYDTVWPLLKEDAELVERAQALGLNVQRPEEAACFVEEMLAVLLQCILDRAASSNLPRESQGALILLRCLDRPDAESVMDWLYDEGPDALRVFTTNDFFPDGTPQEATGGYNSIHSDGLFDLEHHLRRLRGQHPEVYPEADYPSMLEDPRAALVPRALREISMVGKSYFQYGDGSAPGSAGYRKNGSIRLKDDCFHAPMAAGLLDRAAEYTGDPAVARIRDEVANRQHRALGPTVHDGVGIAILRTPEAPERAAAGIVYGDALHHRHRDLLDVQLFAFERPFLTDLGYPQSWASISKWEAHWATHNTLWGDLDPSAPTTAGRGRLVRSLFADGIQVLDIEAYRWAWDDNRNRWIKPGVTLRRLIALVETDGDGVALIDLARVTGGIEHWRACRGLEGEFHANGAGLTPRSGTVAGPGIKRGDLSGLPHPDHTALAYMDDVASAQAPAAFAGSWQSEVEPAVHLDLHQLAVSPGTELLTARATAAMGTPEESNYCYRAALWRRRPEGKGDTSCIDLLFEPRIGEPTVATAKAIPASTNTAGGVCITTRSGKEIALYWAPDAAPEDTTEFENGVRLTGALAATVNGSLTATGATAFQDEDRSLEFKNAVQAGHIVALDRDARTVDVEGIQGIAPGDRITVNPHGRAHSYRVQSVRPSGPGLVSLELDVTSTLGRAPVLANDGERIELGFNILARTGNLHHTRVQAEKHGFWAEITAASNPGSGRTVLNIDSRAGSPDRVAGLAPGEWVQVVDYVVGDTVLFERTEKG